MLSNNPGPMIRCTSMAAPMTSPESLSALANSGCMALGLILEQKETKETKNTERKRFAIRLTSATATEAANVNDVEGFSSSD